ncbi:S-methyl-5-thioribose-1-phosphate isomerase [Microbispora triticiradicis]|uniref:Multifunctional fusion protein n=1 Tax=Microbispora triticiradicis TaxID=2200763 RepID=A0ABX9LL69_9ACTN|nr:S-methyl-5-thioribose-1-phosphate isomerase [Microbispora triticiradicis]RGA04735.1 S-methyl-5-thioribose-1-phosphate isomerase [Microbispora triticiradicis]GLW20628.1 hypothetical protein Mame01_06710 [Microbispora amethystogenes]
MAGNRLTTSLGWDDGAVVAVDQRALPHEYRLLRLESVEHLVEAIRSLAIRGAPAIGLAGALGVALSVWRHSDGETVDVRAVHHDATLLAEARPTAVNLRWGVSRALRRLPDGPEGVLAEALAMLDEDAATNRSAAGRAADLVISLTADRPARILTHCNTGRLATAAVGTALGAILELAGRGRVEEVLVDETRPLLQGARLTTWELGEAGVPHRLCVDAAAAAAMARGLVDCVLVGADRIAVNGDVANKIGTYGLALAAARHGVPFIVVAPESTCDPTLADGSGIVLEERGPEEVTGFGGVQVAPARSAVFNPAFDVTPAELITAIVTERRVIRPQGDGDGDRGSLAERVAAQTREVADFPFPGVRFQDLSGVYAQPRLVRDLAHALAGAYRGRFDHVLAVEARGFLLGMAVAQASAKPLTLCRKPGKLPGPLHTVSYDLEYGTDTLQIQRDRIPPDARVLVVDDVLATGGTLAAAEKLVTAGGGRVCGHGVVLEIAALAGRRRLYPSQVFAVHTVGGAK